MNIEFSNCIQSWRIAAAKIEFAKFTEFGCAGAQTHTVRQWWARNWLWAPFAGRPIRRSVRLIVFHAADTEVSSQRETQEAGSSLLQVFLSLEPDFAYHWRTLTGVHYRSVKLLL